MHERMESPNTSPQAVELNRSCSGQTHSNRSGPGPGYKNTEPGCILAIIFVPSLIRPLRSADAKSGKVV